MLPNVLCFFPFSDQNTQHLNTNFLLCAFVPLRKGHLNCKYHLQNVAVQWCVEHCNGRGIAVPSSGLSTAPGGAVPSHAPNSPWRRHPSGATPHSSPVPDTIWGHLPSRNVAVIAGDLLPPSHQSIRSILITLEFKARPRHCHHMLPG